MLEHPWNLRIQKTEKKVKETIYCYTYIIATGFENLTTALILKFLNILSYLGKVSSWNLCNIRNTRLTFSNLKSFGSRIVSSTDVWFFETMLLFIKLHLFHNLKKLKWLYVWNRNPNHRVEQILSTGKRYQKRNINKISIF